MRINITIFISCRYYYVVSNIIPPKILAPARARTDRPVIQHLYRLIVLVHANAQKQVLLANVGCALQQNIHHVVRSPRQLEIWIHSTIVIEQTSSYQKLYCHRTGRS
jgi:hypothetical protein